MRNIEVLSRGRSGCCCEENKWKTLSMYPVVLEMPVYRNVQVEFDDLLSLVFLFHIFTFSVFCESPPLVVFDWVVRADYNLWTQARITQSRTSTSKKYEKMKTRLSGGSGGGGGSPAYLAVSLTDGPCLHGATYLIFPSSSHLFCKP